MVACLVHTIETFDVEDLVVWRPTKYKHIEGQSDIELILKVTNPCTTILINVTNVPLMDKTLTEVCSSRFKRDIVDIIGEMTKHNKVGKEIGVSSQEIGITSLYFSVSEYMNTRQLIDYTKESIKLSAKLQRKFIIANDKITTELRTVNKDVTFIGGMVLAQPKIDDVMFQVLFKIAEAKKLIDQLKQEIKIGQPVPKQLKQIFDLEKLCPAQH